MTIPQTNLKSNLARTSILNKLKSAQVTALSAPDVNEFYAKFAPIWSDEIVKIKHFARTMESVNTQIIWARADNWHESLCNIIAQKNIRSIVLPSATVHGKIAKSALQSVYQDEKKLSIHGFEQDIETWKDTLFDEVDAGFTDIRCGIAQTGTLVLWPDLNQPRSMSLVPPIHIALFDTALLHSDFYQAMRELEIQELEMPTNVVLISGPSKTADIQLTLAYGAHGPRELIVLACVANNIPLEELI
ncbi:hypothetical protein AwWohl_04440 [Gammaproteobacteria bacterium]|nr:hypothetical protein AwWohl_04440 [Gammaproteobacteria bacterium]